jgi:mannose/fructose/N-acetylgalactosamine-specific phosphotransferase system component IID
MKARTLILGLFVIAAMVASLIVAPAGKTLVRRTGPPSTRSRSS